MTHQPNQFVISIMSRDRIGIIAEVSGAISELEGDIADLRQSVLRGYFTMILLASFPAAVAAEQVTQRLTALSVEGKPALDIAVRPANDAAAADAPGVPDNAYVLTASGPDRIGFVATVSSFCAQNAINILDLSTAVDDGTYIMMLLVDLSCRNDLGTLRDKLSAFGQEMGLNVVLQHYDIFRATNEIKE